MLNSEPDIRIRRISISRDVPNREIGNEWNSRQSRVSCCCEIF